jgi:acyl carrier protein
MGVITLVAYVQEHFGITVEDDEVLPSNLDTIANLVAFVERKIGA